MKAEFELNVDKNGKSFIKVRHHDKSDSIEQKLLGIFIGDALKNGIILKPTRGYCDSDGNSHNDYEMITK